MKEIYVSPALELLCFAPSQHLAFSFDNLLNPGSGNEGPVDNVDPSVGDIPMDISF